MASVREVAGAVTASTLTTVAVFVPVAVVSGITGELFRPFSTTVAHRPGGVAAGLDDHRAGAGVLVPALAPSASRPGRRRRRRTTRTRSPGCSAATCRCCDLALRRPLISALAAVLIFAGTVASTTLLKTDFLESFADKTTLQIDQELPVGTRLSATSEAAEQVEQILAASPGVKEYLTTIGQGGSNRASMFVSLTGEDAYDGHAGRAGGGVRRADRTRARSRSARSTPAPATTSRSR